MRAPEIRPTLPGEPIPDVNAVTGGGPPRTPGDLSDGERHSSEDGVRDRVGTLEAQKRIQVMKALYRPVAAPPPPERISYETPGVGAVKLTWKPVDDVRVYGYNIYGSPKNNPNSMPKVGFEPQIPDPEHGTVVFVDTITAGANSYYYVASVNLAGRESARIPLHIGTPPATVPGSRGVVDLNLEQILVDDFIWGNLVSGQVGERGWAFGGAPGMSYQTVLGRPGVLRMATASNGVVYSLQANSESSSTTCHCHIDDSWRLLFDIRPASAGTLANLTLRVGLVNIQQTTTNPPSNGIYFEKLYADTNWFSVTRAVGVETRTDTGIAVANNTWQVLGIRRTGASTIAFSVDGVDTTPAYTNIPASTISERSWIQLIGQNVLGQAFDIDRYLIAVTGLARTEFDF